MKLLVFSVLDKAVGAYLQPFFARSRAEAIRSFADAVTSERSQFGAHADDYILYQVGEFDDNAGMFGSVEPDRVVGAIDLLSARSAEG